jgi:hypothetical protein
MMAIERVYNVKTGEITEREYERPPEPKVPVEQLRANASMSRAKFLQACVAAGVIEPSVAEEAASGVWPSAFDEFLTGLSVEQRIEAKATWVDGQRVRRDSPILALIAAEQGVTDEQLDIIFGISGG